VAQEGGCEQGDRLELVSPKFFLQNIHLLSKFFRQFSFPSGKIRAYKLSSGIFLDFSDFNPKIFAIFNFRSKNFPAKRISRPEKLRVSGCHGLSSGERFTTEKRVGCVTNTFFPTFAPTFFSFFNFRPENFPVF